MPWQSVKYIMWLQRDCTQTAKQLAFKIYKRLKNDAFFFKVLPVTVERKTWDDLNSSMKDNRFHNQMKNMVVSGKDEQLQTMVFGEVYLYKLGVSVSSNCILHTFMAISKKKCWAFFKSRRI